MASKRRLRRKQCEGKAQHKSNDFALVELQRLRKKGVDGQFNIYKCTHCGFFHIGHATGRNGLGSGFQFGGKH